MALTDSNSPLGELTTMFFVPGMTFLIVQLIVVWPALTEKLLFLKLNFLVPSVGRILTSAVNFFACAAVVLS